MRLGDLGRLTLVPAVLAAPAAAVAGIQGESASLVGHAVLAAVAGGCGWLCLRADAARPWIETRADAFRTVATAWLLVSVLGGLPFLVAAWLTPVGGGAWVEVFRDPVSAVFEGVSGFTSTGLSVVRSPQELPASLQWWRSSMQWAGGMGIVLLMTALVVRDPRGGHDTEQMHEAEFGSEFRDRAAEAARQIWIAYLPLTALTIVAFGLAGMPWWEAVNHGMSAISTGGFTITHDSLAGYPQRVAMLAILPMVIGATSFTVILRLLRLGDLQRLTRDHVLHLFLGGALLLVGLIAWLGVAPLPLTFDTISALTTSGFSVDPKGRGLPFVILLLTFAMVVGGMRGSTAGGWKVDRVFQIGHGFYAQLRRVGRPDAQKDVENAPDARAGRLLFVWLVFLLGGAVLLRLAVPGDRSFADCMFECSSALSTVGLSQGIAGPDLHPGGKLLLIVLMWVGRLEIVPALMLVMVPPRVRLARS